MGAVLNCADIEKGHRLRCPFFVLSEEKLLSFMIFHGFMWTNEARVR